MEIKHIEGAIEALLFAAGEAVEITKIANAIEHDTDTTRKIIRNMELPKKRLKMYHTWHQSMILVKSGYR